MSHDRSSRTATPKRFSRERVLVLDGAMGTSSETEHDAEQLERAVRAGEGAGA